MTNPAGQPDTGDAISTQAKDADRIVVPGVFFAGDSRHVVIQTAFGTVCTQITDLGGVVGPIKFAEITGTVAFHYKPVRTKALASGALMALGDNPYCPANVPKLIELGDNTFIGVRAALNQLAGTLHITLLY